MACVLRWMRALTLASVLLGTGVAGHVAAGGAMPATVLLMLLLVGATLVLAPGLGSPASSVRVALLVVGGQVFLHVGLRVLAMRPAGLTGAGMVMPSHAAGSSSMSGGVMFPHVTSPSGEASFAWMGSAHVGMLLAHLVAGLALGLWLAAGERAAWMLVQLAARPVTQAFHILLNAIAALVSAVSAGVGTTRGRPAPGWAWELALRSDECTVHCLSRRGPPRVSVA